MKTKILTLLCMFCAGIIVAQAQAKKRPTAKKPATAAAAKKPAASKSSGKFAILDFDQWIQHDLFEDANYIYFLDYKNGESNTLRAVDKKTGEIKIVVPRKTRRRAKILCAGADSSNIYMRLDDIGIVRFNGTDVNTSEVLVKQQPWGDDAYLVKSMEGSKIITSPNGRYIALIGLNHSLVYDQKAKLITGYYGNAWDGILTNDGTLYYHGMANIGVLPKGLPSPNTSDKKNATGHQEWKMKDIGNGGGGLVSAIWFDDVDSMLYVAMGEQIMRSPMKNMKWEEAYVLPGENKKFTSVVFSQNHVFAETDNFEKHYYEWTNKRLEGAPTITKQMELETDIVGKDKWSGLEHREKITSLSDAYCDWNGNFWLHEGDSRFFIYNPNGIVGLSALKGKITKSELPPVD
jgi:hypothetical protein